MAVEKFDGNETAYLSWMNRHPEGFVINTGRSKNSSWFILHRSKCSHITSTTGFTTGAYTERKYIKLASEDLSELISHVSMNYLNFQGIFKECKTCLIHADVTNKFGIGNLFPEVLQDEPDSYAEGAKLQIIVNAYERNPKARQKCLDYHGYDCKVCGLIFSDKYGQIGRGFIHVHHIAEFSFRKDISNTNPVTDLVPVCPNCHSMLHRKNPCYTVEELKLILQ